MPPISGAAAPYGRIRQVHSDVLLAWTPRRGESRSVLVCVRTGEENPLLGLGRSIMILLSDFPATNTTNGPGRDRSTTGGRSVGLDRLGVVGSSRGLLDVGELADTVRSELFWDGVRPGALCWLFHHGPFPSGDPATPATVTRVELLARFCDRYHPPGPSDLHLHLLSERDRAALVARYRLRPAQALFDDLAGPAAP